MTHEAKQMLLAVAAIMILGGAVACLCAAFVTRDWRWLTVALVAWLLVRRT